MKIRNSTTTAEICKIPLIPLFSTKKQKIGGSTTRHGLREIWLEQFVGRVNHVWAGPVVFNFQEGIVD